MALDIQLYRRTIYTPIDRQAQRLRRISVIDIHPEGATRTLVLVHGYGGSATQWLYQLQYYDREVPESLPLPKQLLHDMLSNAAREFPDRAALIFFGQKIGYRELDRLSNRFAHALRKLGIQKGDRVAIVLPNIPQFVIAFLRSQPMSAINSNTVENDLALLQYTSGTTDTPKGVMLSHGNLVVNVVQVRHWMPDAKRGREVVLCALPLSHSYGVTSCMNTSIGIAGTLVLLPTSRIDRILEAIKHYRPSIFPGIPALYLAIANYPRVRSFGVAAIRTCISRSAPLPVEVQEEFEKLTRGRLVEGYGLTEASPVTHSNPLKGERHVGSIGIPLPGTNACIVDWKTGEPLPPGEIGELLINGPQVMQGYWNMPEETRDTLKNGWLHTKCLARLSFAQSYRKIS